MNAPENASHPTTDADNLLCSCKGTVDVTRFLLSAKHFVVNINNIILKMHGNPDISTKVRAGRDGQTEMPNSEILIIYVGKR